MVDQDPSGPSGAAADGYLLRHRHVPAVHRAETDGTLAPNVIGTAWSPNLYAYNVAFVNQDANYAAALAFLLGIVIMIVSYVVQLSSQRKERRS